MKRKEAIEKLNKLLFAEQKFENAKLQDGTIIQWDGELKEGTALMKVDEAGNTMPCEDGTFVMEDGTEVYCTGGLVTKIEMPNPSDEMSSEFEQIFTKHIEQFSGVVSRVETLENAFAELKKSLTDANNNTESKFTEILKIVSEIAVEPSVKVEAPKNTTFSKPKPAKSAVELFNEFKKSQETK